MVRHIAYGLVALLGSLLAVTILSSAQTPVPGAQQPPLTKTFCVESTGAIAPTTICFFITSIFASIL